MNLVIEVGLVLCWARVGWGGVMKSRWIRKASNREGPPALPASGWCCMLVSRFSDLPPPHALPAAQPKPPPLTCTHEVPHHLGDRRAKLLHMSERTLYFIHSSIQCPRVSSFNSPFSFDSEIGFISVRDESKLLDDGGEISKSEGRGWWFDSRL